MQGSGLLSSCMTIPNVECVGAADLYDGRHVLAREITGNPNLPVMRAYQNLLDRKDIDCIIAASRFLAPPRRRRCLQRGQRHLLRKTHDAYPGRRADMIAAAGKNKRIVQIGSQRASGVVFGKAHELYKMARSATSKWSSSPSAATIPPEPGISTPARSLDAESRLGYLDLRRAENPVQSERFAAGAAGRNTAPASAET